MKCVNFLNCFFKKWGPLITVIGIIVSIIIYYIQLNYLENQIDKNLMVTSCINLITTDVILEGENKDWVFIARYSTNVYWGNWSSALNNYSSDFYRTKFTSLIYNMESINKSLDQEKSEEPFFALMGGDQAVVNFRKEKMNELLKIVKFVKTQLNDLGFNDENCKFIKDLSKKHD